MRVLLLTLYFSPDVAANAVIMTELAEELVALGHQVTVVTTFPHYAGNVIEKRYRGRLIQQDEHRGIRVLRTYVYTSRHKQRWIARILNYASFHLIATLAGCFTGPQDIILAPSPPLTIGVSAYIVGLVKRIPYVYNVQDIYPDVAVRLGAIKNPLVIRVSQWLERFVYAHAQHVTVLSEGFRSNLLGKGVPEGRMTVAPNFVDVGFVRPLPRDNGFRRRFNLTGRFVVLYAGNIGHSQNLEHVLESAALLRDRADILFLIVGNGSRKPQFEALAQKTGLDNVRFLPFQPREEVPTMYAAADICLITLRKGIALESVPSKAYTIMASGRPVVAAVDRRSDTWTLLEGAQCGICVEPEDPSSLVTAILDLYKDPARRARLGQNGREHVEAHYTRQSVGRQYHELLTSLVRHGSSSPGYVSPDGN